MFNYARYVIKRYSRSSSVFFPNMFVVRALRRPPVLLRARALHAHPVARALPPRLRLNRAPTSTDYTVDLMTAANSGHFGDCLELAHRMKVDGIPPNSAVYNVLMQYAARDRNWLFAWAIFDDMLLCGVEPTSTTFVHLINAQADRPHVSLWNAIDRMHQCGIQPTAQVYTAIINCLESEGNMESSLGQLVEMKVRGIVPELPAAQAVISMVAQHGLARLAIELAMWFEGVSNRRLEAYIWMECLNASASSLFIEGVLKCWPLVTNELNLVPTELVSTAVLNTAARHGHPELATDALRLLQIAGVHWQEYHFAALIEAYCRKGQIKEALLTLPIMKAGKVDPIPSTSKALLDTIRKDVDTLDAAWAVVDELHASGEQIDIDSVRVVVEASIHLEDLQRAVGIYKSLPDYNLHPDLVTFNLLLDGCIQAQHRQLGDLLIQDMKEAHVQPDASIFEKMIHLCLTQEVYEDAFFYLEEMKAAGHVPPASVYEAILQKTLSADDARSSLVLQEMQECGYTPKDARDRTAANAIHVNKRRRQ